MFTPKRSSSCDGDLDAVLKSMDKGHPILEDSSLYLNPIVDYQKAAADVQAVYKGKTAHVLIFYTGGTLGCISIPGKGYMPAANWLTERLKQTRRFHDPEFEEDIRPDCVNVMNGEEKQTIELETLVTPKSIYGKRIRYCIYEYSPLLDSANMNMSDWVKIAADLELNYSNFDAFIVVHGTDTLAYTASALSFMLEDLGKPVVLTGSQVPLAEWRTDAEQNLLGALLVAGHFMIPEVCLFFSNKLIRGNRSTKIDALDFTAFDSPNMKALASVGVTVNINWNDIRQPQSVGRFYVHRNMSPDVASLRIFPGISAETVASFLAPPIQGVILETFGVGNAPCNRKDLMKLLKDACDRGVVIVNCSQCQRGYVSDLYETGKALSEVGVVPGSDMTSEAALTKLSYLLGKGRTIAEIRKLMTVNLRGELTLMPSSADIPRKKTSLSSRHAFFIDSVVKTMNAETLRERQMVENALLPHLVCATAGTGNFEEFEKLHEMATDSNILLNALDFDGRSPLHIAAAAGNINMVEHLIKLGSSVHMRDKLNETPLSLACKYGHMTVADYLFNSGANFGIEEENVRSDFLRFILSNNEKMVHFYLKAGIDPFRKIFDGISFFDLATLTGKRDLVILFEEFKKGK